MLRRTICPRCRSECEYNDKSVWEGNREMEEFCCPVCDYVIATVFTDQIPYVRLIKKGSSPEEQ